MAEIIKITGFDHSGLDVYARLTERELIHPQKGDGIFIAESPNVKTAGMIRFRSGW